MTRDSIFSKIGRAIGQAAGTPSDGNRESPYERRAYTQENFGYGAGGRVDPRSKRRYPADVDDDDDAELEDEDVPSTRQPGFPVGPQFSQKQRVIQQIIGCVCFIVFFVAAFMMFMFIPE